MRDFDHPPGQPPGQPPEPDNLDVTDSAVEPPPRSTGELKQLVGVASVSDIVIDELDAPESASLLEVHEETRNQLRWKPKFYAQNGSGTLKIKVTRLESEALLAAGASRKH
jgi:hypothetical protein